MSNVADNLLASMKRYVTKFIEDHSVDFPNLQYFNFEAAGDNPDLPAPDLMGIAAYSIAAAEQMLGVELVLAVSTNVDTDLIRLTQITHRIFEDFIPGSSIPVLDAATGEELGFLIATDGTRLMASGNVKANSPRPIRMVTINLLTDQQVTQ